MIDLEGKKKLLIVRLGKIGDIIITSSIFDIIKEKYPDVHISLLTLARNKEVLKYNPKIDKIYFTRKNILLYFLILSLRRNKYDILIDFNDDQSRTSGLIRKVLNADTTVGFDFGIDPKPDISIKQPPKNETHIIERIKLLLESIGISLGGTNLKPVLYINENVNESVKKQYLSYENDSKIIALNLSAGAPIRYWQKSKWIELIKRIDNKYPDFNFILLSSEADKKLNKTISEIIPDKKLIKPLGESFQYFASYISNSDLIITADTSAVHIASAFNKPQIVLFSKIEWNFVSWQPLSEISESVKSIDENIKSISVDKVWAAFENIIKKI